MEKQIYEMKLFDYMIINQNSSITRVPGGWVYSQGNSNGLAITFIPFDNEFMPK